MSKKQRKSPKASSKTMKAWRAFCLRIGSGRRVTAFPKNLQRRLG